MKKFLIDTWYGPVVAWCAAAGLCLAAMALEIQLQYRLPPVVGRCAGWTCAALLVLATLFGLAAFIYALACRQWKRAVLQLVTGLVACVGFVYLFLMLMFAGMFFGPSEDHFADDLTIPANVVAQLVVPEREILTAFGSSDDFDDDFAQAIFKGLKGEGGDDPTVTCDLSALANLVHNRRDELMAYLARHPGWWLHEDGGRLCATRRLRTGGVWNHPLHGCYSGNSRKYDPESKEDFGAYQKATHYQTRTTIGFPYSPFGRNRGAEHPVSAHILSALKKGNLDAYASSVCFGNEDFCVDVFEELPMKERRITNAALAFLKDEFASLKLPDDAAVRGPDEFVLRSGMQPGIYNLTLRINPGEAGVVYLKAYEVTKGTRLSEGRLYDSSNERVGWSGDPQEKFLYENEFTIYEGDWGKPYAARIEVWFRPDSGGPERKLLERICKVEGWQR